MDICSDAIEVAPELEYELENSTNQRLIKLCTPRRLISELFNLNLSFMDQFFDTYPIFLNSKTLLQTLIRIYREEEEIYIHDSSVSSSTASIDTSLTNSQDIACSLQSIPESSNSESNSFEYGSIPISRTFVITPSNSQPEPAGAMSLSGSSKFKRSSGNLSTGLSVKKHSRKNSNGEEGSDLSAHAKKSVSPTGSEQGVVSISNFLSNHLRVLKILSNWLTKYYTDFQTDPALKMEVLEFINDIIKKEDGEKKTIVYTRAKMLENTILQFEQEKLFFDDVDLFIVNLSDANSTNSLSQPPSHNPAGGNVFIKEGSSVSFSTLIDFTPLYVAHGLTQISLKLQQAINIRQFLNQAWTKADRNVNANTIIRLTVFFNRTTQLIKSHILSEEKVNKRVKIIEFWIETASELLSLENYNALSMVIGALESNCVYRLKKTWGKVSKKSKQLREKFCELMSPSSNYATLRSHYKKENYIPFMGPFLTELCYIEERNKLQITDGRVNFKKMRLISRIISPIRKSMNYKFAAPNHPEAKSDIMKVFTQPTMTDSELNERSALLEPYDKNDN